MRYISTRKQAEPVSLRDAILGGTAPDGGLYLPETLAPLDPSTLSDLRHLSFVERSFILARHILGDDLPNDTIERIVSGSFDFPVPLIDLNDRVNILELFHGPTLAFKDFGARFLARLTAALTEQSDTQLTVLVATSGDTGSAIAQAFHKIDQIRVVVLFPAGYVSARQQKQFTTLGGNITAVAIDGTFDDCQALAKRAFADQSLRSERPLMSANSVNIGRLIPQMFYYFHAAAQLPEADDPVVIAVPSGNVGNLTAGLIGKRIGLPCQRFIAATNANDVVPEYLHSGEFKPQPSIPTISNAMDVGHPSNFERMAFLYGGDADRVRRDLLGFSFSDQATREAMKDVSRDHGYTLDPHSAVGYLGLQAGRKVHPRATGIVLATAHPAKFPEVVEAEIGRPVAVPDPLKRCLDQPEIITSLPNDWPAFRDFLQESG